MRHARNQLGREYAVRIIAKKNKKKNKKGVSPSKARFPSSFSLFLPIETRARLGPTTHEMTSVRENGAFYAALMMRATDFNETGGQLSLYILEYILETPRITSLT